MIVTRIAPLLILPPDLTQNGRNAWMQGSADGFTAIVVARENLLRNVSPPEPPPAGAAVPVSS